MKAKIIETKKIVNLAYVQQNPGVYAISGNCPDKLVTFGRDFTVYIWENGCVEPVEWDCFNAKEDRFEELDLKATITFD